MKSIYEVREMLRAMDAEEAEALEQEERLDWSMVQIHDLFTTGYLSEDNYDACINRMGELYGAEYIGSRMVKLGLIKK